MVRSSRIVILSPHPDDAIWSLGGAITSWLKNREVLVITLYDGDPTQIGKIKLTDNKCRWRSFGSPHIRRLEDQKAMNLLGCQHESLGYIDAALRLNVDNTFEFQSAEDLFPFKIYSQMRASKTKLQKLLAILKPEDEIIAPLAFGNHIDHIQTHAVARNLPYTISYYADFPYYLPEKSGLLDEHINNLGLILNPVNINCDWQSWKAAALCYRSQVIRLFGTQNHFIEKLTSYSHPYGTAPSCRIWSTCLM